MNVQEIGASEPYRQFELGSVSGKLTKYTSRRRHVGIGAVIFLAAFALFFVALDATAIADRNLSAFQILDLAIAIVGVSTIIGMVIPSVIKLRASAIRLRVDELGFELDYPDGKSVRTLWSDPKLSFELIDCSDVNPTKLLAGVPHFISVRGVRSLLTKDAFQAMVDGVAKHGLVDSVTRGSRWIYSGDANPLVHHIHAHTARP
jgi:hypothetical protein